MLKFHIIKSLMQKGKVAFLILNYKLRYNTSYKGCKLSKGHDKIGTRLAIIINKLNSGESFTAKELSNEFNVTPRTIQKDLHVRLSYLPIKKDKTRYFLEEFYLGKLNFQDIKNFATLSSIKGLYPSLDESFLKNILDSTINSAYTIKGQNYEDTSEAKELFSFFEKAINNHEEVELNFLSLSLSLGRQHQDKDCKAL